MIRYFWVQFCGVKEMMGNIKTFTKVCMYVSFKYFCSWGFSKWKIACEWETEKVSNFKVKLKVADLASKAFTTTHVRDDLKIYTCRAMSRGKDKIKGSTSREK